MLFCVSFRLFYFEQPENYELPSSSGRGINKLDSNKWHKSLDQNCPAGILAANSCRPLAPRLGAKRKQLATWIYFRLTSNLMLLCARIYRRFRLALAWWACFWNYSWREVCCHLQTEAGDDFSRNIFLYFLAQKQTRRESTIIIKLTQV